MKYEVDYEIEQSRSRPPRKYEAGKELGSLEELDEAMAERAMLWQGRAPGRPAHALWVGNLNYGTMRHRLQRGEIRRARVRQEYIDWLRAELDAVTQGVLNDE